MKYISSILCAVLCLGLLAGCGLGGQSAPAATDTPAAEPETAEETPVGMINPVRASSAEEIEALFGVAMNAPEGAEDVRYAIIDSAVPLAQMNFSVDGLAYTWRVARTEAYEDISGMYYEWQDVSFEEGDSGVTRLSASGAGLYDRYDAETGMMYSLSMDSGATAEGMAHMVRVLTGQGDGNDSLGELFSALHEGYFPGTAGSSLKAAANAARLADCFAETGAEPDAVARAAADFAGSLSAEERATFELQLEGVAAMFTTLTEEGGEGILADCGYAAAHYPWNDGNVRDCFAALLGSD